MKRAVALRLGVRQPEFSYAFRSKVVPAATLAAAAAGAAAAAAAVAAAAAGAIFYFTGTFRRHVRQFSVYGFGACETRRGIAFHKRQKAIHRMLFVAKLYQQQH